MCAQVQNAYQKIHNNDCKVESESNSNEFFGRFVISCQILQMKIVAEVHHKRSKHSQHAGEHRETTDIRVVNEDQCISFEDLSFEAEYEEDVCVCIR